MTDNGAKALAERLAVIYGGGANPLNAHDYGADAILATGAVFLTAEEAERLGVTTEQRDRAWSNLDMAHDDIAALLRAAGLGDYARPVSTHDVMQRELLPAIERLRRIETAGSILLSAVNVTMPEVSPYGCPHSRDWLNGMLDDLRAALTDPSREAVQ